MSKKFRLSVIEAGQVARVEEVDSATSSIKVGRLSSSHLRFEDQSVSRIHAVIEPGADGNVYLIDLGSAAGTFINGQKITKQAISSGDELQFGSVVVRYEVVDASAAANAFSVDEPTSVPTSDLSASLQVDQQAAAPAPEPVVAAPVVVAPVVAAPVVAAPVVTPRAVVPSPVPSPVVVPSIVVAPQPSVQIAEEPVPAGKVRAQDGSFVEPYTMAGYNDEQNNYIPGYYDDKGEYHLGYGFYDDHGKWCVAHGYYTPDGEWIETVSPVGAVGELDDDRPSDREVYTEAFVASAGGDTLEVAMLWCDQVLAVNSYPTPRAVMIGRDNKTKLDFVIDHDGVGELFPLVAYEGGSYQVNVPNGAELLLHTGQEALSLDEAQQRGLVRGGGAIALSGKMSARIDIGEVTFLVHYTDQPVLVGIPLGLDFAPVPYITMSAIAHIAFLVLALTMPDDASNLEMDGLQANDRFVQLIVTPPQEEEPPKPDWMNKDDGNEEAAAKHKGDEGKAGKEDTPDTNKRMAIKGDASDVQVKKAYDTNVAMNAGVFADGNQVASLFGTADDSIGSDAVHAIGALSGESIGESGGMGAFGVSGSGRGGGGVDERGFGSAAVGTHGRGGGGSGGSGYGKGAANLGDRPQLKPQIVMKPPEVMGSLTKEQIERVVRQHRNEIKFCYEQELQKNPKLAGSIKIKFTISGTGSVMSALVADTSMKSPAVERCMTGKIQRWAFPEPKGGGIVIVNYPFNFSA
jgi:hypothetical protein